MLNRSSPVWLAILAAVLFAISTPAAKLLVGAVDPPLLAGLLYLGSGIGLTVYSLAFAGHRETHREASLTTVDLPWLLGAIIFGGVIAPLLLINGLSTTSASTTSLLLNFEGLFTALLAWFAFHENFDRRVALGMLAITAGGVVLSAVPAAQSVSQGLLLIILACLCWSIDNNLTRKISGSDPTQIAAIKGLAAGCVNCSIALSSGAQLPSIPLLLSAITIGFLGYGLSLSMYVRALRELGAARTGAYFSTAPFAGAA